MVEKEKKKWNGKDFQVGDFFCIYGSWRIVLGNEIDIVPSVYFDGNKYSCLFSEYLLDSQIVCQGKYAPETFIIEGDLTIVRDGKVIFKRVLR